MHRKSAILRFLFFAFVISLTPSLIAQSTGQLRGQVVDATDLSVPEATITVKLPGGDKAIFSVFTSKDGLFSIPSLVPDAYDVVIVKSGFEKQTLRNVRVTAARDTVIPTIKLEVQSVRQGIDVLANVISVQTTSVDVTSTITNSLIQKLPMLDRYPLALIQTQPGVSDGRGPTVINGLRTSYANVTLDGINIQDNFIRTNSLDYIPNLLGADQVGEMSITTSNGSSTLNGGGAHVAISTPSGANQYHGSIYWYNKNSLFAANDWFNNRDGIKKPRLNQNQIGATVSGPIFKDKLLFYGNYEAFRLRQQASRTRTILTSDARNGIFTYVAGGATQKVNILQAMGISPDPATQALLAQVPLGSSINTFDVGDSSASLLRNTGGYSFVQRDNRTRDNVLAKFDYHASTKHSFVGTYAWNRDLLDRGGSDINTTTFTVIPKVANDNPTTLLSLAWRWNPTAYLTNELRGGMNLAPSAFNSSENFGKYIIAPTLISNPVNIFRGQGRETNTYSFMDNASWVKGRHLIQFGVQTQHIRTAPYNDAGITPTYTLGIGAGNAGLTAAQLPGISSTDLPSANSLLALLGGYVTSYTQTFNITDRTSGYVNGATNLRHFKFDQYGYYVQDKWKMNSRLTATLGLRYDYFGVLDERDALFLLPQVVNNNPIATLLSNATLDFSGSSIGKPWYGKDWNNFAPSIGVALDPTGDGKLVLRGAYSVSYVNDEHIVAVRSNVNTSSGLSTSVTGSGLTGRVSTGLPPIPIPTFKVPRTLSENYTLDRQTALGLPDPKLATPYVQEWNLEVEHDFKGTLIQVRYVGNHAVKAFKAYDINQVVIRENGFLEDFLRAQSNGNLSRAAGLGFLPAYNPAIAGSQPLTVFPLLAAGGNLTGATGSNNRTLIDQGQVGELANQYQVNGNQGSVNFFRNPFALSTNMFGNSADSSYDALQIDVHRNFKDLQLQVNYTKSKVLSNAAGDGQTRLEALLDNANPQLEVGKPPYDVASALKANGYYNLPVGRGHWFNVPVISPVLSGWSMSSIMVWQSGVPISILSARGTVNRTARSASATANAIVGGDQLDDIVKFRMSPTGPYIIAASAIGSDGRGVAADGSAPFTGQVFFHPTAGSNGTLQRRMFNGPSVFNMDFALYKTTHITEGQTLELRMEASNIFNHATFQPGDQTISSTNFGKITGTFYDRRLMQFSAHYRF